MTREPDGMDWFLLGEVLAGVFRRKQPIGVVRDIIVSYAVARDLDPMELAAVALNHVERIRRIEQAETACDLMSEAEKHFGGER